MSDVDRLEAGARVWPLAGSHASLGRRDDDIGVYPEVDLTELDPDRLVSRKHASVERSAAGWTFRDVGSANGSTVDGRPAAPGRAVALRDGSRITIGDVVLVLRLAAPDEAALSDDLELSDDLAAPDEDATATIMGRRRLPAADPATRSAKLPRRRR